MSLLEIEEEYFRRQCDDEAFLPEMRELSGAKIYGKTRIVDTLRNKLNGTMKERSDSPEVKRAIAEFLVQAAIAAEAGGGSLMFDLSDYSEQHQSAIRWKLDKEGLKEVLGSVSRGGCQVRFQWEADC